MLLPFKERSAKLNINPQISPPEGGARGGATLRETISAQATKRFCSFRPTSSSSRTGSAIAWLSAFSQVLAMPCQARHDETVSFPLLGKSHVDSVLTLGGG